MPRDRVGHLWVLHAKSVPRNGLWERRDLELITGRPGSPLPCRALETRLDHRPLVGEREQLGRNFHAKCLCGGEVEQRALAPVPSFAPCEAGFAYDVAQAGDLGLSTNVRNSSGAAESTGISPWRWMNSSWTSGSRRTTLSTGRLQRAA